MHIIEDIIKEAVGSYMESRPLTRNEKAEIAATIDQINYLDLESSVEYHTMMLEIKNGYIELKEAFEKLDDLCLRLDDTEERLEKVNHYMNQIEALSFQANALAEQGEGIKASYGALKEAGKEILMKLSDRERQKGC